MDFEFSDAQRQLKDEVRRFLSVHSSPQAVRRVLDGPESYDRSLWCEAANLGLMGVAIPEEYGGAGGGCLELCAVAEEIGRATAPMPFSSSIYLGAELVLRAGSEAQRQFYLPKIATGETIACLALSEGLGNPEPRAVAMKVTEHDRLTGTKWPVLDGDVADLAVVAARDDAHGGISLFIADLSDATVSRSRLESIDPTRSQARVTFLATPVQRLGPPGKGWELLDSVLQRAAVLTAFEQIGGAERALEAGRDYALERRAFGRQIGAFQAIKHKLVDMWIALVLARSNAYFGAWAASTNAADLPKAAATARVSATQAFQLCSKENIQIHGGMGFTWDLDCHVLYRRSQLLALTLGGLSAWQDRLVATLRQEYVHSEVTP
jgi:alkylation response protein AidB-like acyl-CoA dehydrogenase